MYFWTHPIYTYISSIQTWSWSAVEVKVAKPRRTQAQTQALGLRCAQYCNHTVIHCLWFIIELYLCDNSPPPTPLVGGGGSKFLLYAGYNFFYADFGLIYIINKDFYVIICHTRKRAWSIDKNTE